MWWLDTAPHRRLRLAASAKPGGRQSEELQKLNGLLPLTLYNTSVACWFAGRTVEAVAAIQKPIAQHAQAAEIELEASAGMPRNEQRKAPRR